MWTGPDIISHQISVDHLKELHLAIKRKPIIWDNLFANDYDIRRAYFGPLDGRSPGIKDHISGLLLNPNCEYTLNFVPIHTLGTWICTHTDQQYVPYDALQPALDDWLPYFSSSDATHKMTREDVAVLVDMFYLPSSHGKAAKKYLSDVTQILTLVSSSKSPDTYQDKLKEAQQMGHQIISIFRKITKISDRDLCYDLYKYCWDIKEEMQVLKVYLAHVHGPNKHLPARSKYHLYGKYRGGFLSDLQSKLEFHPDSTFTPNYANLLGPTNLTFRVEPYNPTFEDGAYNVCLKTGNSGNDGTHLFPDDPKILGHRYVGPYLHLQPDLAFNLVDDQGVCGYVLGALDTIAFNEKVKTEWLPKLRAQYEDPTTPSDTWTPSDNLRHWFHHPQLICHDIIVKTYPSHLHIDLLPRAQSKGLGTLMITRLLLKLTCLGSSGVWLEMSSVNHRALKFYTKMGFSELLRIHDNGTIAKPEDPEHALILGRTLGFFQ